jgi:O-antigen ligase
LLTEKNIKWIYVLSILFILGNCVSFYFEFYLFPLLPAVILIILLALFALEALMLFVVFVTPFAINLQHLEGGLGISLPTEPIIFGIMIIYILKQLHQNSISKKVLNHPITIAIFAYLFWLFITSLTSNMPIVSFKFLIARLWYIIVFYFLAIRLFKKYDNINRFTWLYITSFSIVILYTLYQHYLLDFGERPANYVMSPFYNDHTIYGAMIAMFFPFLLFFLTNHNYTIKIRFAAFIIFIIFTTGLIFSYTRAAWLSLGVAIVAYIILQLRIKFLTLFSIAIGVALVSYNYRAQIKMTLEKNRQDASQDFSKHIKSMSNISTDASNLERLNRWNAAFRMFEQRPLLGWGPGTYAFKYAPFQLSHEKTIISTNSGDGGNAHSEYLGPLSEAGILGLLTFVAIIMFVLATGFRLYYSITNKQMRITVLVILLGFITYIVHGGLNDFLDTDKAAVPFWGFIAMLVAIDVYHKNKRDDKNKLDVG